MKGKSQRNRGLFKALDGRKRGPPHGGWKNKDPKPKYVRAMKILQSARLEKES